MIEHEYLESAIKVWPFDEAPDQLQNLSGWNGDEEWVIYIPEHFIGGLPPSHDNWPDLPYNVDRFIYRLADNDAVEWHELKDGDWVAISCRE